MVELPEGANNPSSFPIAIDNTPVPSARDLYNMLLQALDALGVLDKRLVMHLGIDNTAAGMDYPHPSQRVRIVVFGEGAGQLDATGIRMLQTNGIVIAGDLTTPVASLTTGYVNLFASVGNTTRTTLTLVSQHDSDDYSRLINDVNLGVSTSIATLEVSRGGNIASASLQGASTTQPATLVLTNAIFRPVIRTSDHSTLTAGDILYRSDTNKFRGVVNATAMNFAMEGGPHVNPYVAKTGNYTTVATDGFIACSASGGAFTITLITAVGNTGLEYTIKKTDSSTNLVTIDGNGSQTIDGVVTTALSRQFESICIVSDGANWLVKARF